MVSAVEDISPVRYVKKLLRRGGMVGLMSGGESRFLKKKIK